MQTGIVIYRILYLKHNKPITGILGSQSNHHGTILRIWCAQNQRSHMNILLIYDKQPLCFSCTVKTSVVSKNHSDICVAWFLAFYVTEHPQEYKCRKTIVFGLETIIAWGIVSKQEKWMDRFYLPLRTHPVIVMVEVLAVFHKGLNVFDEFSSEVWLEGHQLVLHLCATGKQFLPGVPKCVHFLCFLFGNQ